MIHQDKYIMDGNYARTLDLRLNEADTVFYFDFSRYLCLYRVIKRRIQNHGRTRVDMAQDCQEKIDFEFLSWIWNFNKNNKPKIVESLEKVKGRKQVYIFKSPRDMRKYMSSTYKL
ncbi:topology modulation protein [compost metagenome]